MISRDGWSAGGETTTQEIWIQLLTHGFRNCYGWSMMHGKPTPQSFMFSNRSAVLGTWVTVGISWVFSSVFHHCYKKNWVVEPIHRQSRDSQNCGHFLALLLQYASSGHWTFSSIAAFGGCQGLWWLWCTWRTGACRCATFGNQLRGQSKRQLSRMSMAEFCTCETLPGQHRDMTVEQAAPPRCVSEAELN